MHGIEPIVDGDDAVVDAVLTASRVLVAIAARSPADADEKVTLTQHRPLVAALRRLAANAGEVPEQDWSSGWTL